MNSNRIESNLFPSPSLAQGRSIDIGSISINRDRNDRRRPRLHALHKVLVNFHVVRSSGRSIVLRLGGGIGGRVILDEVVIEAEAWITTRKSSPAVLR